MIHHHHLLLLLLLLVLRPPPALLQSSPLAAAAAAAAEKAALLSFKSSVSDPKGSLSSWVPSGEPCRDFDGVLCSPDGSVERLILPNAGLSGGLPSSLSFLRRLRTVSLPYNSFYGLLLVSSLPPTLFKLNVSSNSLSGGIPSSLLSSLPSLRLLDLSSNSFAGNIPPGLFSICSKARFFSFAHNQLNGTIPDSVAACPRLEGFDLSYNSLSGDIPPKLCSPPALAQVSLRANGLSGTVSDKLSGCRSLEFLDLGSNSFLGLAPFDLLRFANISYFNLSSNGFQGEIPQDPGWSCGERLRTIDVSGNHLSGVIPSSIGNCKGLRVLDLGFNGLGGSIPAELGNLRSLSVLRLEHNAIGGTIPEELGGIELLQILDLSDLQLSGDIPASLSRCQFLLQLDLSGNGLGGGIPDTLNNVTFLKLLDLHHNNLTGAIPATVGELTGMQYLDLSENSLSGAIPSTLANLTLLTHFNVSFNNLTGSIPSSPTILQFGPTAFMNNTGLCGPPLDTPCTGNGGRKTRVLSVSAIVAIVAAAVILAGVCVVSIMNIRARGRRRSSKSSREEEIPVSESTPPASNGSNVILGKLVLFSKSLPSKYEDWEAGTKALLDKDCLIGGGSIGTVYKASFEGGVSIAVKKLETLGTIRNQEEFEQEIGRLGSLLHLNLVVFQGYYWSPTTQLILSEFIPNGNLYQHLHEFGLSGSSSSSRRSDLSWSRRFNIALGTARALSYLHHDCKPQLLHLNIKSTNILLDEAYEAKLSDYGLGKLSPILGNYHMTKFHTSMGYLAPELASQSLSFSDKCDVYSFGVLLLEIVTGRKPVDSPGISEVVVLRDYVRGVLEDGTASDCFDRSLRRFVEAELIQVLKLGLFCTSDAPVRRPSMAEVVQFLESIKTDS